MLLIANLALQESKSILEVFFLFTFSSFLGASLIPSKMFKILGSSLSRASQQVVMDGKPTSCDEWLRTLLNSIQILSYEKIIDLV